MEGDGWVRLGIDARYAFRQSRRGIGEYVAELLRHLPACAAADDEFLLYLDGPADPGALVLPDGRFRLRQLGAGNPLLWEEVALPVAAAQDGLDLLHLTANYGPSLRPCPTVYTIHDLIEFLRPTLGPMRLPLRHAAGRAVRVRTLPRQARGARRVITISEASRQDLLRILHLRNERVVVIPQGVSEALRPAADAAAARESLRAQGYRVPERYVLAMGALDPRKNGPFLLRAFARARADLPDVSLWVVGVERPAEYPLPFATAPDWLVLDGFLPREALVRALQGAAAFAYPSLYEGFGLPVLEAMACGVPVLSSDSSALPEVVGGAGLLFDPRSEPQLAAALRRLLGDPALAESCRAAARAQVARFSWAATAEKTYAVYREVYREVCREVQGGVSRKAAGSA